MNNRQTFVLGAVTVAVLVIVVIIGVFISSPQQPQKQEVQSVDQEQRSLNEQELDKLLDTELATISDVLVAEYPQVQNLYTINRGQLYDQGQWYGTTLTYRGDDEDNRDTLRVLMQKKNNVWVIRTKPPQLLLSQPEYSDVPKVILQHINQPAELPGTLASPAIN